MPRQRKVYLIGEQVYADLISEGAYASRIQYTFGGTLYDVLVDNNEFIYMENDLDDEESD